MPYIIKAPVIANEPVTANTMRLILRAPEIAAECRPGQFVNISAWGETYDPLLKRPFSICDADKRTGQIVIIYNVVGKGTRILASQKDSCDLVGPLGNGFPVTADDSLNLLIGGGAGCAPMKLLETAIGEAGGKSRVICGFGTAAQNYADALFDSPIISTDDGTCGVRGFVTGPAEQCIRDHAEGPVRLCVCGPTPMMKAVCALAAGFEQVTEVWVSLENVMACGIGVCTGCVCKLKSPEGFEYKRVCKDGPVFRGEDVIW